MQVPDRLQTFTNESGQELTFGNFIRYHDYEPEVLLAKESWTEWKAKAQLAPIPMDPELVRLKKTLLRAAFINGPREVALLRQVLAKVAQGNVGEALALAGDAVMSVYYRLWGDKGSNLGITSLDDAFHRLARNPSILADLDEILAWSQDTIEVSGLIGRYPNHGRDLLVAGRDEVIARHAPNHEWNIVVCGQARTMRPSRSEGETASCQRWTRSCSSWVKATQ